MATETQTKKAEPCVYICTGVNVRYRAGVRRYGHRNYDLLGKRWGRSSSAALKRLADAMTTGQYKRGVVLMVADYYDPEPVYEIVRC